MCIILDTGDVAYWTAERRRELGRCIRCEWHVETQGHADDCPEVIR